MELLTNNHFDYIYDLFDSAKKEIKIISPFLSYGLAEKLVKVKNKHNLKCQFITRFYLEDMFSKSNDLNALELMIDEGVEVFALRGLHSKLYLFDDTDAVVGSANFTTGGFCSNIELSLAFSDGENGVPEMNAYFADLLFKIKKDEQGRVNKDLIQDAREKYKSLLSAKLDKTKSNNFIYGAMIDRASRISEVNKIAEELNVCKNENRDIVYEAFKVSREHILNNYNTWLKLEGSAENRLDPSKKYESNVVYLDGRKLFPLNYTATKKPSSVREGDIAYIAPLSQDIKGKNQPIVIGRGVLKAFNRNNDARNHSDWCKKYRWMEEKYPWYCELKEHFIIDTEIKNGIPLQELWDKFGSDLYEASFGKDEPYEEVAKKHHEKCHIRLSGNAAEYLDKRLEELSQKYGVIQ